jgi:ribulose-phosphate 3-epimerase
MSLKVAPSVIAGDQAELGREVRAIDAAGADLVHLDVMDGHFVPNLTLGPGIVKDLRPHTHLPFDCHLMLADPGRYIDAFARAGADRISVHVEIPGVGDVLRAIRALGKQAGLVINPETPLSAMDPHLDAIDFALVMTVHPGFYGQKLIPEALDKVPLLRQTLRALKRDVPIQVDGGVTIDNVFRVARAGADEVVAGAAVFKAPDYRAAIQALREPVAGA